MRPNKRDELVRKALAVFYRDGFHATGMDTLVVETGISKTSMYKHFRTKEELILAALHLRDEDFRDRLFLRMGQGHSPRESLLALFDFLRDWFGEAGFRGCMFIKAAAEYQEPDHPIHLQAAEHKRLLFAHVRDVARDAGAGDPDMLARQLLLLKEGAIVAAQMGYEADPAGDARNAAEQLLAMQLPKN